jgi:GATA-binding protein
MYGNHLPVFNGHLDDHYNHHIHQSPSLPPMHLQRQATPGRSTSPINGQNHMGLSPTPEQLIAENAALKTRVSELEVINELFRGRVTQLEQDESNARRGEEMRRDSEHNLITRLDESQVTERNLISRLDESQRRENQLKRRLDDLERELADLKDGAPPAKKMRVADMVGDSEASTPQSVA